MRQDPGYKLLFVQARMVEDLLRGFVPEAWVSGLDFATLERVNTSTVRPRWGELCDQRS